MAAPSVPGSSHSDLPSTLDGQADRADRRDRHLGSALESALANTQSLPRWMGWRLKALVALVLAACIGLFALAHHLAGQARLPLDLQAMADGQVRIQGVDYPPLQSLEGRVLLGLSRPGPLELQVPLQAQTLNRSVRWLSDAADRRNLIDSHARITQLTQAALTSDHRVLLELADAPDEIVFVAPQGWRGLPPLFWGLMVMALAVYVVAIIVAMSDLRIRNLAFAVMTLSQAGQLVLLAMGQARGWLMSAEQLQLDLQWRIALDLIGTAALLHLSLTYPRQSPLARVLASAGWALAVATWWWTRAQADATSWWTVHGVALLLTCLALWSFGRAFRATQHPVCLVVRRFVLLGSGTWLLLLGASALATRRPDLTLQVTTYGVMVWHIYAGLTAALSPYLSRTRPILLELSMLAVSSTIAASLDLLFVAAFSFGQFTSMTLSLFLSFGIYLIARRWLLNRLPGRDPITMERLFQRLYRIAREVERRPDTLDSSLMRLMRELFDPLEVLIVAGELRQATLRGNGAVLLVPVPMGTNPRLPRHADRVLLLKHASKGQRLFTVEDARLAVRVLDQLNRALSFDQAVEQGRSEERLRIAQDLHDDIGARLLTLMYQAPNPDIEEYIRHTIQDLKTLTRGLAAQSHGLTEAAAEWKRDLSQRLHAARCELDWQFSVDDEVMLTMVQWSALTRIIRELVSNAISHAKASRVRVSIHLAADCLTLEVEDNGLGREPASWSHGLGLGGVRKRVKQLGGRVRWVEAEPRGIRCEVVVEPFSTSAQPTGTLASQQGAGTHPGMAQG